MCVIACSDIQKAGFYKGDLSAYIFAFASECPHGHMTSDGHFKQKKGLDWGVFVLGMLSHPILISKMILIG